MEGIFITFSIFVLLLLLTPSLSEETLVFVYTQFRHGARGASSPFEQGQTDFFGEAWISPEDLTGVGMRMHYTLGLRNRKKYKNFLKPVFDPREILVTSTDFNRTIQSVYAQLQGLYAQIPEQDITEEEERRMNEMNGYSEKIQQLIDAETAKLNLFSLPNKMQIFPIHIYNKIDHKILLSTEYSISGCKGVIKIRDENKKLLLSTIKTLKEKEEANINNYFNGKNKTVNTTNVTHLAKLCDEFKCDVVDGRFDKNIISETFEESCTQFQNDLLFTLEFGDKENKILKMSQTPVFQDMLYYMSNVISKDIEKKRELEQGEYRPKFVMVSGHDVTLMGVIEYMKHFLNKTEKIPIVPFATSVFFEVYRKEEKEKLSSSDYIVKYYINDDLIAEVNFDEMNTTMRKDFWSEDEIANFCEFDDWKEKKTTDTLLILVIIFSIIGLLIVVALIIVIVFLRKKLKVINYDNVKVSEMS